MNDRDEEVARWVGNLIAGVSNSEEEQYEINPYGAEALYRAVEIIQTIDEDVEFEFKGDPYHFDNMGIRVRCVIIDMSGGQLDLLKELTDIVSVIGVTPTSDGELIIELNVPDVFCRAE